LEIEKICILGIESSCDDTSASIFIDGKMASNIIDTQKIHQKYGGILPEAASRQHEKNIVAVVDEAIEKAGIKKEDINAVAFTRGPGLIGSLLVGTSFAKGFALAMNIPLIEVNHMKAHIMAHFIDEPHPAYPFLCLTVSGGHSQIVKVTEPLKMEVLGETLDDAAGEAYDKCGKVMGLPYPAGPVIDELAQEGNPDAFTFPDPKVEGLNYSFSGIKTAFLYFVRDRVALDKDFISKNKHDLAASIQKRINTILLSKLKRAIRETSIFEVAVAGGVSANRGLRELLKHYAAKGNWNLYIAELEYCTDNAAMIAITGHYKYLKGEFASQDISPLARMPI
jgi:tRNA N6-adenosine threonylcarbamoyltransferase